MYGQDVYYLPREIKNLDKIFLDDIPSRFSDAYKIEMYIENAEGFEGEGDLFTKFGIELRDQANFVVSRKRWTQLIGSNLEKQNFRPREGDLIYLTLTNSCFEIRKVETETPFYQLSQLPTFRLQCELFEYSGEDFDTGVDTIQDIEQEGSFKYNLSLDSGGGRFIVGETVTQVFDTYNMTGEVAFASDSGNTLHLIHSGATDGLFHEWTTTKTIIGDQSQHVATPTSINQINDILNDNQNKTFDDFESDFLDFSESNPFGDVSVMFGTYFYHKRVRSAVSVFGSLFNNLYVLRKNSAGETISQVKVPLSYAPKRNFISRLESMNSGEQAERRVAIKLPRMSFEITSITYDETRQLNKMNNLNKVLVVVVSTDKRYFLTHLII